jgi:hypothetical protein
MQILFQGACVKETHRIKWHELTLQKMDSSVFKRKVSLTARMDTEFTLTH